MSGYFAIRSRMSGLVLDVKGCQATAGTPVNTWTVKGEDNNANQLWSSDPFTGAIRSKLNPKLCLHTEDGNLTIENYTPNHPKQQWTINGPKIQLRLQPDTVLDVAGSNKSPGARVTVWKYKGSENQHWDIIYETGGLPSAPPGPAPAPQPGYAQPGGAQIYKSKAFFITSDLNGKVLDIEHGNMQQGAKVIMWGRKATRESNQLWYSDVNGILRSKLNDYALDSSGPEIRMSPYQPHNTHCQWMLLGNRIANPNLPSKCLDIFEGNRADGAALCAYKYYATSNQHWKTA